MNEEEVLQILNTVFSDKYIFYPSSVSISINSAFVIGKDISKKYLFILGDLKSLKKFKGEIVLKEINIAKNQYTLKKSSLTYYNVLQLKEFFPYIWPKASSAKKSFGTGDRLGIVAAAHIEAFKDKDIFPILAQQSMRELKRTGRTWQDVINDTVWGYFETGCKEPFGADADHVKKDSDLKSAAEYGFTMFTVDPSDYIQNISNLSKAEVTKIYNSLGNKEILEKKYLRKGLVIGKIKYYFDHDSLISIAVKYVKALNHVSCLYDFIKRFKKNTFGFEVSVDEIETPVSPLEHYFIAKELKDAGVNFQNIALRLSGRWEKAVDYIGDIKLFEEELKKHVEVLKKIGNYKLSLHSGSEKFSIYKAFSAITGGNFHIKTAGTSWLEALRVIAISKPSLFRDIYNFSLECFEKDKVSYHLSTDTSDLPAIEGLQDEDMASSLDIAGVRQILHVTFGSILTLKEKGGNYIFRDEIYSTLYSSEDTHYKLVRSNINKHLNLLEI